MAAAARPPLPLDPDTYPPDKAAGRTGLNHPSGVAVDTAGNLLVADPGNGRIREMTG